MGTDSITLRVVHSTGADAREPKQVCQENKKVTAWATKLSGSGTLKTGGLYVLKRHSYIRIGVRGDDDLETKIKKSTVLAQMVLQRL